MLKRYLYFSTILFAMMGRQTLQSVIHVAVLIINVYKTKK
ncbi:hypothetical protein SAPIG1152 [Staphylococcus aureus subsp. aureus ST398]|nr:hypothetical protein SAPIG1152 [Staphylococcus aureus subsp. aureus ST398]